jgi:hypothetical protein
MALMAPSMLQAQSDTAKPATKRTAPPPPTSILPASMGGRATQPATQATPAPRSQPTTQAPAARTPHIDAQPTAPATPATREVTTTEIVPAEVPIRNWTLGDAQALLATIKGIDAEGLYPADYKPQDLTAAIAAGPGPALDDVASRSFDWLAEDLRDGRTPWTAASSGSPWTPMSTPTPPTT